MSDSLPNKAPQQRLGAAKTRALGRTTEVVKVDIVSSIAQDVNVQDQHTPPFMVKANQVTGGSTLAVGAVLYSYEITVADATSINIGDYLGIFSTVPARYYVGTVLGINGNVLTLDTQIDFAFTAGSLVGTGFTNMNVDGSSTPSIFTVRGADPGVGITIDVTRILFTCITTTAMKFIDFGNIPGGLTRGFCLRTNDGIVKNIFNFKTNIEMKGWMLDWEPLDDPSPAVKIEGFVARLTFNGQNKLGVTLRIGPGESLEFIVQDDMTYLTSVECMVEGHEVEY